MQPDAILQFLFGGGRKLPHFLEKLVLQHSAVWLRRRRWVCSQIWRSCLSMPCVQFWATLVWATSATSGLLNNWCFLVPIDAYFIVWSVARTTTQVFAAFFRRQCTFREGTWWHEWILPLKMHKGSWLQRQFSYYDFFAPYSIPGFSSLRSAEKKNIGKCHQFPLWIWAARKFGLSIQSWPVVIVSGKKLLFDFFVFGTSRFFQWS